MNTMHKSKFLKNLKNFSESSPVKEVCGFVVYDEEFDILQSKNYSPLPEMFEIHPADFLKIKKTGKLVAIFHTHVSGDAKLSEFDFKSAKQARIPYLIYSLDTNEFELFYESNFEIKEDVIEKLKGIING